MSELAIIGCSLGGLLAAARFAEHGRPARVFELDALLTAGAAEGLEDCGVLFFWPDAPAIAALAELERAIAAIAPRLAPGALLVLKADVPTGAGAIAKALLARAGRQDVRVALSPEQPCHIGELASDERLVIGVDRPRDALPLRELYGALGRTVLVTTIDSAERLFQVSLAYWRTEAAFAASIAALCAHAESGLQDLRIAV